MGGPVIPRLLGYAGLLPFVGAAAGVWLEEPALRAVSFLALGTYGAVILSFLGAVHWGRNLADGEPPSMLGFVWSVIPSLIGWGALLLPPAFGLSVLVAGFLLAWGIDLRSAARGRFPAWYGRLRTHLTIGAVAAQAAAIPAFL